MKLLPVGLLAASIAAIVTAWWWLGRPVAMPAGMAGDGGRLQCVSYAPFRADQNPLELGTYVKAEQITEDLTRLHGLTDCVRTYSIEHGVDQVPEIAQRLGMKVMLGLWLSPDRAKDRVQVDTAVALAKQFPGTVTSVIVGNEVLLRGDMSPPDLAAFIHEVKAAVPCPVTYADVWEFWSRYPDIAAGVDFVTIHLLPYWEDVPIPAEQAPAHVDAIRRRIMARFPGKEVMIGEVGWPSAGRMREGALPSPVNQARFLGAVTANARRDNYRVNVIEAFDQPWKRQLEGTVGGHWGLLDAYARAPKFDWGGPVSNHPYWLAQAAGGALLAVAVFGAAGTMARRRGLVSTPRDWLGVALVAVVSGTMIGWAVADVPAESLGIGGWLRSLAWVGLALLAPPTAAAAVAGGVAVPSLSRILGRADERPDDPLALALGALLVALAVLALQVALVLVFDPRYIDFPFAPLLAASVSFGVAIVAIAPQKGVRPAAETLGAATLAGAALYIAVNETIANWQALALCAGLAILAFTLARLRVAPG